MNELTMNLRTDCKIPLYEQIYQYIKSDIQNFKRNLQGFKSNKHQIFRRRILRINTKITVSYKLEAVMSLRLLKAVLHITVLTNLQRIWIQVQ